MRKHSCGRKPLPIDIRKSQTLSVKMRQADADRLRRLAARNGVSLSVYMRQRLTAESATKVVENGE